MNKKTRLRWNKNIKYIGSFVPGVHNLSFISYESLALRSSDALLLYTYNCEHIKKKIVTGT